MRLITSDSGPSGFDANQLLERIRPQQRLVLVLPSGRQLAEILLACYSRGIVVVPVDPRTPEKQIEFIVRHCEATAIFRVNGVTHIAYSSTETTLSQPDDRFIIYTSGSTGDPKGVVLTKTAVEANSTAVGKIHGFTNANAHATCLPLYHVNALAMSLIGTYLSDSILVLQSKFEPNAYFNLIERENVKTASIVPALLHQLVKAAPPWPQSLKYLITAAAPLPRALAARFFELYGPKLRQGYGLSEAVNFSFLSPLMDEQGFKFEYIENDPPVGLPIDGTEARLVDGEVQVRGPNLMRCYWKNPETTAKAITEDGWLRTGDLGEWRGQHLILRGRKKEIINRGGETFYPVDIEEEWERHQLPRPFSALAIPNEVLSDDIGLWIENVSPVNLKRTLDSSAHRPGAVQTGPLLVTSTGKPQRKKMGAQLFSEPDENGSYEALLVKARFVAESIVNQKIVPQNGSAKFILKHAHYLLNAFSEKVGPTCKTETESGPAFESLELLEQNWATLAVGELTGAQIIQKQKGLWTRLMQDWPMGAYAHQAAKFMKDRDLLSNKAVLELGAGVGNTTRLIVDQMGPNYVRTDLFPSLLERTKAPGTVAKFDFNEPGTWQNLDLIFGVNTLHCASNYKKSLKHLYQMLAPGGMLVLGEGAPFTTPANTPWALTYLFGMFEGWWDIGGFVPRHDWLGYMEQAGFKNWGYSVLRSKQHDLGGVMWATK